MDEIKIYSSLPPKFYKKWVKAVVSDLKKFVRENYKSEFVDSKPGSEFLPFSVKQASANKANGFKSVYVYGKPVNISFVKDSAGDVPNSTFVDLPRDKWKRVKFQQGFRTVKRSNENRYSFREKPLNDGIVRFWSILRNNKEFVFGETSDGFVEYILSDKAVSSWLMEECSIEVDEIIFDCFNRVYNEFLC